MNLIELALTNYSSHCILINQHHMLSLLLEECHIKAQVTNWKLKQKEHINSMITINR